MKGFNLHEYMESFRKLEDSLCSTVKISHSEVCILVVKDLISKRNNCKNEKLSALDTVLRFYLTEDEFERFVIKLEDVT